MFIRTKLESNKLPIYHYPVKNKTYPCHEDLNIIENSSEEQVWGSYFFPTEK